MIVPRVRADLLDPNAPEGTEVVQLTEGLVPTCHIYMEAQVFVPDSRRFVLHRSATAHGPNREDPLHQYLVCDIEDNCALHPVTNERGAVAPSVSPDGRLLYYFLDELQPETGRLTLKRVNLDGTDRQDLVVIEGQLSGTPFRPTRIYPLSTISSDGKRLAIEVYLADGRTDPASFGLLVFDLAGASFELVHHGPSWLNMHPQYCRSTDPEASHDLMIQENHGNPHDPVKDTLRADVHCICDDGTNFRNFPWGRDGNESCHGHQCWRGRSTFAIGGTGTRTPNVRHLVESRAVPSAGHVGLATPGGARNVLSREPGFPRTAHFATDIEGRRLVTDAEPYEEGGRVVLMDLGDPGRDPARNLTPLAWPRTDNPADSSPTHIHPFLSPDGSMAFFNSNESGTLQAYMICGLLTRKER